MTLVMFADANVQHELVHRPLGGGESYPASVPSVYQPRSSLDQTGPHVTPISAPISKESLSGQGFPAKSLEQEISEYRRRTRYDLDCWAQEIQMTMRTMLAAAFVLLIGFLGGQEPGPSAHHVFEEGKEDSGETVNRSKPETVEIPLPLRDPKSKAKSAFIDVNGVKHHYLDWGGEGEPVLLLAGLGNTAHIFESFGSKLANGHRVLALTRRGHGQTASPISGYDTKTRVEDMRIFLDSFRISKVILIGHSIAGDEITLFSAKYPERVSAAIYIDAAYDRRQLAQLNAKNPLRVKFPGNLAHSYQNFASFMRASEPALNEFWQLRVADFDAQIKRLGDGSVELRTSPKVYAHYNAEMSQFHVDGRRVTAPVLAIYATSEKHPFIPTFIGAEMREQAHRFWKNVRMPAAREQMRLFREALPDATIIELKETDHFCFISREADVIAHIRSFLEPIDQQGKE